MVSLLKSDQSLKTTIGADAELHLPIWHCGTRKAFLMHLSSALNTIEKRGTFKSYKEAHEAYVGQCEVAKQAKANMSLFTTPTSKGKKANERGTEKTSKEASGKDRSEKEKAYQKTKEGAASSDAPAPRSLQRIQGPLQESRTRESYRQKPERSHCNQDVSVLCELVVFGCKVCVE